MRAICCLLDLYGAPMSSVILRKMLGGGSKHPGEPTCQALIGPVGLACRGSGASSPTLYTSSDQQLVVVADSRLDNRQELQTELSDLLLGRCSGPDAELIAAAYRAWGRQFLDRLSGDFAFVLWDGTTRQLLAARDPMGIRRLHFAKTGSRLCLATESHQVLRHPAVSPELDEETLADYLCGLLDSPERSMFRSIRALRPGHCLVAQNGQVDTHRYWDIDPDRKVRYSDSRQYAEHLRETLREAVRSRLPEGQRSVAGILLSGGLDSCSVAGLAREILDEAPNSGNLVASSLVFDELSSCDERPYIAEMAPILGAPSNQVVADGFGLLADTPSHPDPDSPFMAWEAACRTLLGSLRQQGATHLLTGLGGDELLTGHPLAYFDRLADGDPTVLVEALTHARRYRIPIAGLFYRRFLAPALGNGFDQRLRKLFGKSQGITPPSWLRRGFLRKSGVQDRLAGASQTSSRRRFGQLAHQKLYESIVVRAEHLRASNWFDRRAGAQGLEARHPFIDRRLLELVLSFPSGELFRAEPSKPLLRQAMSGILPERIRARQEKTTLGSFADQRLRDREAHLVTDLLAEPILGELGLVDPDRLRDSYQKYQKSRATPELRTVWYAISLESWLREHADFLCFENSTARVQTQVA